MSDLKSKRQVLLFIKGKITYHKSSKVNKERNGGAKFKLGENVSVNTSVKGFFCCCFDLFVCLFVCFETVLLCVTLAVLEFTL